MANWGPQTSLTFPRNPVTGEQPPRFRDGRYHLDELYFHLDEATDHDLIEELITISDYWQRQDHLALKCPDRLLEWGVLHELKLSEYG